MDAEVVEIEIEGELARVRLRAAQSDDTVVCQFHKIGEHWLLHRPGPLPAEIQGIVRPSLVRTTGPGEPAIIVDRSSTQFPEQVHLLAQRAWLNGDMRAFAECMTEDSMEAHAVMMLGQVQMALQNETTPDDIRGSLAELLRSNGMSEQPFSEVYLAGFLKFVEHRNDPEAMRRVVDELLPNCAELIQHKPRFCAEAQTHLHPVCHGQKEYEVFHIRHLVRWVGTHLEKVTVDGATAVGRVGTPGGKSRELQFALTDDGWRISLPVPIPKGKLPDLPLFVE